MGLHGDVLPQDQNLTPINTKELEKNYSELERTSDLGDRIRLKGWTRYKGGLDTRLV